MKKFILRSIIFIFIIYYSKNENFVKFFMKKKLDDSDLDNNLLNSMTKELDLKMNNAFESILNKKIVFSNVNLFFLI